MVGSGSDRENSYSSIRESDGEWSILISIKLHRWCSGDDKLDCNGYEDSYDLQNGNTAVCLNVGSRGDITSFRQFNVSIESGGYSFSVFT